MLAKKNLEHDYKKTFGIVFILSLIGFLLLQQFGSILGRWESLSVNEQQWRADLVVYFDPPSDLVARPIRNNLPAKVVTDVGLHPDIEEFFLIDAMSGGARIDDWPRGTRGARQIVVEDGRIPLTYPKDLPDALLDHLTNLGDVVITKKIAKQLNVKVGDEIKAWRQPLFIKAIALDDTSFEPLMVISQNTADLIGVPKVVGGSFQGASFSMPARFIAVLVNVKDGKDIPNVAAEIRAMFPGMPLRVVPPATVAAEGSLAQMLEQEENESFLITALLTIGVCCLIATQTMRSAILGYREEFGILLAQGVSSFSIRLVALEMAFWLGLLSVILTLIGAFVMVSIFNAFELRFALSVELVSFVSAIIMLIALLSGLIASQAVSKIKPSALLR